MNLTFVQYINAGLEGIYVPNARFKMKFALKQIKKEVTCHDCNFYRHPMYCDRIQKQMEWDTKCRYFQPEGDGR